MPTPPAPPRSLWALTAFALAMAGAALALWPSEVRATTYGRIMGVDELLMRSDRAVRGRVISLSPRRTPQGYIETVVDLSVSETLHGPPAPTARLVAPGGVLEGVQLQVDGAPVFKLGDEVVVFLHQQRIVGFGQGAWRVQGETAERTLGNRIGGPAEVLDLSRAFGRPDEVEACLDPHLQSGWARGLSLRVAAGVRLGPRASSTWDLTLLGGAEYEVRICADTLVEGLSARLTDASGAVVAEVRPGAGGREPVLLLRPPATGSYTLSLDAAGLSDGAHRGAAAVAVMWR